MRRPAFMLAVGMVVGVGLGLLAGQLLHAQPETIKRTMLLKTDLAGYRGPRGRKWGWRKRSREVLQGAIITMVMNWAMC